jgi:N-acetylmuramoyl-L-alanine amidase
VNKLVKEIHAQIFHHNKEGLIMSYLIAIDDGHGMETAGKRTPAFPDGTVIRENQFNSAAAKLFAEEMKRCGCEIIFTAPTDVDTPLGARVRTANNAKADLFISFHYNAFTGIWDQTKGGVSTHYYVGSERSKRLAQYVQDELIKGTAQANRGIVPGNLYVNKYTTMPAVLIEAGFMDVTKEAKLMLDKSFQKEVAREAAIGVCKYLGIAYVEETAEETPPTQPVANPQYPGSSSKLGSKGENVRLIQIRLNEFGYYGGAIDGSFGPITHNAVIAFQLSNGLTVDGRVGPKTWERLFNPQYPGVASKRGSKGENVKLIQRRLNELGYNSGSVDGSFGPITHDAVIAFQKSKGLAMDGSVGPLTWAKLFN